MPNMRDSLAAAPAERWKTYMAELGQPMADVNILVTGTMVSAARVTAGLKQAIQGAAFRTTALPAFHQYSLHNQPWKVSRALKTDDDVSLSKWTLAEVSQIFQLPMHGNYFKGIGVNAFSLLPESDLLPEQLTTCADAQSLYIGKSVYSSQKIYLPAKQLLHHTVILGKTGCGKTTALKNWITQFHRRWGIGVTILEPIKREYRDLLANLEGSKIFTVEKPTLPLLMNPFLPPEGVALCDYRGSLMAAFKAALSMPDPLPAVFEKSISEAYALYGWTDISTSADSNASVFDMADFVRIFKSVIERSSYSNEVKGNMMSGGALRLQSLIERCPKTFGGINSTSLEDLLTGCTLLEMGALEAEEKLLISALVLIRILAYLKATRESDGRLRNVLLLDEAHALLDHAGTTQEEDALNSTMSQLFINVISEMRAYGIAVVISDQSARRLGGQILDSVDNMISYRLSGEEAKLLTEHIGGDSALSDALPLLNTGEYIVKNSFLRSPLAARTDHLPRKEQHHFSDEDIVRSQLLYLRRHAKDYCPYALCEKAGCSHCSFGIRDRSNVLATQIFADRSSKLRTPQDIAAHIVRIPDVLSSRLNTENAAMFKKQCACLAVHLLRKCAMENGVTLSPSSAERLLIEMHKKETGGTQQ